MAKQEKAQDNEQSTLLDLNHKSINPSWIDPDQPLKIPDQALHWKAHKLQILVETLQKQAEKNPAQFNSKNYIDAIEAYTSCIEKIKGGIDDTARMAKVSSGEAETVVEGNTPGVDPGVSADNPFAG